jgi:hypothetical protein
MSIKQQKYNDIYYLFSIDPFKFQFSFKLNESGFVNSSNKIQTIVRTNIGEDILIIMLNNNLVRLYSLLWIHKTYVLGERGDHGKNDTHGLDETGIPLTFILDKQPPVLFEIQSLNHTIIIGGVPLHALFTNVNDKKSLIVYNVENKKISSVIPLDDELRDHDQIEFHPDQSGNLINLTHKEFSILEIQSEEISCSTYMKKNYSLKELFKINLLDDFLSNSNSTDNKIKKYVNKYGREINSKNAITIENDVDLIESAFCYEDNLNLLGFLLVKDEQHSWNDDDDGDTDIFKKSRANKNFNNIHVNLYNNLNGSILRKLIFKIKKRNNFNNSYQFYIDLDYLIIIEKSNQFYVYVYMLKNLIDK